LPAALILQHELAGVEREGSGGEGLRGEKKASRPCANLFYYSHPEFDFSAREEEEKKRGPREGGKKEIRALFLLIFIFANLIGCLEKRRKKTKIETVPTYLFCPA